MKLVVFIGITGLLSGCMAPMVMLRNEKGEIVRCEAGAGNALLSGYVGTKMQTESCAKQYEAAGFRRLDGQ